MKNLSLDEPFHSFLVERLVKLLKRVDFLFILIFVLAFAVRFHNTTGFIMNDEVGGGYRGYGYLAWGYFDSATMVHRYLSRADFTGLYNWMVNTNGNYPVLPFLMSASMLLLNSPTLVAARFPVEVLGALLAAVIYLFGRDLFSRFAGLVSGLFVALDPLLITYSRVAYLDVPMVLFVTISVFTLYRGLTRQSRVFMIFSGVACGLAILTKVTAWLLLPLVLILFLIWKIQSGERLTLTIKNLGVFLSSFIIVLLASFPWVGYEILTGKYFSWYFSVSSSVFSNVSRFGPTSIIVFMVGKLSVVELLAFGLGTIVVAWQIVRAKQRFPRILALSWFLLAFIGLQQMPVILNHYIVFLVPPVLLIAGYGVSSCPRIISKFFSMLKKSAPFSKPKLSARIVSAALLLLVAGAQLACALQYYPYLSLYSNPLVGGLLQTFEAHGEEGIPAAVDFLKNHVPDGSAIAVAGQVHLFAYYLPQFKIVGLGELYPYSDEPLAFLYLSGIKYLVVQTDYRQMFDQTDPVLQRLPSLRVDFVSKTVGYDLIWIYDLSDMYEALFPNILDKEWTYYQGNVSNRNGRFILSIAPNYTYAYAISEIGEVDVGSKIVLALEVSDFSVEGMRVEIWSNETQIGDLYPPKLGGIWTRDISDLIGESQSPLRLILVAVGKSRQFLELQSILLLREYQ